MERGTTISTWTPPSYVHVVDLSHMLPVSLWSSNVATDGITMEWVKSSKGRDKTLVPPHTTCLSASAWVSAYVMKGLCLFFEKTCVCVCVCVCRSVAFYEWPGVMNQRDREVLKGTAASSPSTTTTAPCVCRPTLPRLEYTARVGERANQAGGGWGGEWSMERGESEQSKQTMWKDEHFTVWRTFRLFQIDMGQIVLNAKLKPKNMHCDEAVLIPPCAWRLSGGQWIWHPLWLCQSQKHPDDSTTAHNGPSTCCLLKNYFNPFRYHCISHLFNNMCQKKTRNPSPSNDLPFLFMCLRRLESTTNPIFNSKLNRTKNN